MIGSPQFPGFRSQGRAIRRVVAAGIVWSLCLPFKASAQGGFNGPAVTRSLI